MSPPDPGAAFASPIDGWRDERVVLTLDAGGSSFRFSATRGNRVLRQSVVAPCLGDDLKCCLEGIAEGFAAVKAHCPTPPVAISFGFPGPADYPNGVIGDLQHLPAFRGGVALGPYLEQRFGLPVFINNDGDLFTYGEAIAGFLPYINNLLEKAGSSKRYRNLFGVTLGTGFGGGIVRDGRLFLGDNSLGAEIWLLRNKLDPTKRAEEGANIRAVRRVYAEEAGMELEDAPEPKVIFAIAHGDEAGDRAAALEAFRQLGEVVGDAMASALTLVDGLAVVGGGLSGAWPLFAPCLLAELNSRYISTAPIEIPRLLPKAFDLQDAEQTQDFLQAEAREVTVPDSSRKVPYNFPPRIGIGVSRLGTTRAIAIGAYCFALQALDR